MRVPTIISWKFNYGEIRGLLFSYMLLASCALIVACSSDLSQSVLDEHEQKWLDARIGAYSYEFVRYCFCDGSGEIVYVVVDDGVVVSASYADSIPAVEPPNGLTITRIYDLLRSAVQDDKVRVTARFSSDGLLPLYMKLDHSTAVDGDWSFELSNFSQEKTP